MRVVAVALVVIATAGGAAGADSQTTLPIYPQAGVLWKDLYPTNFVDLDPESGARDYACGTQTYDGHTGTDTIVRSFREMDIGVPVFAALDGEVISVQDGFYDREHGATLSRFDNHVVVQHAPGRFTIYGHLRRGIELRRGDRVLAGRQIGWTASSGNSSWPHLHFTTQVDSLVVEPFAGPCREGESGWAEQAQWPTEPYARDLAISAKPFRGRALLPWDEAVRTGTFVRGARTVYLRLELGAVSPTHALEIRLVRPDGSVAVHDQRSIPFAVWHGYGHGYFSYRVDFSVVGRWTLEVWHGKVVAKAPLRVVSTRAQARNRRPNPVDISLVTTDPLQCRITTSLVTEDPDYDVVSYRYRWTVDGRAVRTVTSAALSDVLRRDRVRPGSTVACSVTPSDGKLSGPAATSTAP